MIGPLRRSWSARTSLVLACLLLATVYVYRGPLGDILLLGLTVADQSHILLAPAVAAWLFWLRRVRLQSVPLAPSFAGPALVALAWVLHWWAIETDTQIVWHGAALLSALGCLVAVVGLEFVRCFAAAFGALVFLIPLPGAIQQLAGVPLQGMATGITQSGLELLGIGATRAGFVLIINGEQIAVGEACNGMRMVLALTLVVYAFAFSINLRPAVRVALLAISPLVALFCNVLRLVPTTLLYGYSSADRAEYFHDLSGWLMLPVALVILVGLLRMIRWIELPITSFRLALR